MRLQAISAHGRYVPRALLVAVVFALSGKASLLLAIPPGYATAVWPPAGIALAALLLWGNRYWVGVWIGSFSVNWWISGDVTGDAFVRTLFVCAGVATGATVQTLTGVWLIRRKLGWPSNLERDADIGWFLCLAGPISCVISASCGVACLLLAGTLELRDAAFTWCTWWVGDTIGVMIFAPLMLLLFAQPRELWKRRALSIGVPLLIAFACAVTLFLVANGFERKARENAFVRRAETLNQAIKRRIGNYLGVVHAIDSFFASSSHVTREEFRTFVAPMLERYPGLHAVSMNRCVKREDRAGFEDAVRRDGLADFQFTEFNSAGRIVTAADRPHYVVVTYLEPFAGNEAAIGFDAASVPDRQVALGVARDSGVPAGTRPLRLAQERDGQPGVLIYLPLYRKGMPVRTVEERRAALDGYIASVFRTGPMIDAFLHDEDHTGIELSIDDTTDPAHPAGLFNSSHQLDPAKTLALTTSHQLANRNWTFHFRGDLDRITTDRNWSAWFVLAGGLVLTSLLGGFLLVLTGRTARVEQLVVARTGELRTRNDELAALNRRLEARSNEVMQLSYAMTHDLQTPLATLTGSMDALARQLDAQPPAAGKWLDRMQSATGRMASMLDDLMQYARAGSDNLRREPVAIGDAVEDALAEHEVAAVAKGAMIKWNPADAKVMASPQGLRRAISNLIGNAIKFLPHDRPGHIEVTARVEGESVRLVIADNGPGIPPDQLEHVFLPFKRGPSVAVSGTGLGLSTVRRFIEAFGGRVWLESDGRSGTTAQLLLPTVAAPSSPRLQGVNS